MTSDAPEMVQLNTRVPADLLEEIEKEWMDKGYANRSEFVRHALRMTVQKSVIGSEQSETDRDEKKSTTDHPKMEKTP